MGRCAKSGLSIFERGLTAKRGWGCLYHKMLYYVIHSRRASADHSPGRALLLPSQNARADESCFLADSPLFFSMLQYSPIFSFRTCPSGALVSRARMNTIK